MQGARASDAGTRGGYLGCRRYRRSPHCGESNTRPSTSSQAPDDARRTTTSISPYEKNRILPHRLPVFGPPSVQYRLGGAADSLLYPSVRSSVCCEITGKNSVHSWICLRILRQGRGAGRTTRQRGDGIDLPPSRIRLVGEKANFVNVHFSVMVLVAGLLRPSAPSGSFTSASAHNWLRIRIVLKPIADQCCQPRTDSGARRNLIGITRTQSECFSSCTATRCLPSDYFVSKSQHAHASIVS